MVAANSSRIPRVPLYLGTPTGDGSAFAYGAITRYGRLFQTVPLAVRFVTLHQSCVTGLWLPRPPLRNARMLTRRRFGLVRFRSPLLPESYCFLFLWVLRWFTSPRSPPKAYEFSLRIIRLSPDRVSPFGHSRINVRVQLPETFRSLPRPSSQPSAKAFTVNP